MKTHHLQRNLKRKANREKSDAVCSRALEVAEAHGYAFLRHCDSHYTLIHPQGLWRLDIHPGNQRIYSKEVGVLNAVTDRLFLDVHPWTILDVVNATIAVTQPTS